MSVILYHNPACGTSRNTLAMIRACGVEPQVIEYLQTGWTAEQLLSLCERIGAPLRALLREKDTPAKELGLLGDEVPQAALLEAMIAHPILVNRPIVATPKGTKLCRPSEAVLDLLDDAPTAFIKEDGQLIMR